MLNRMTHSLLRSAILITLILTGGCSSPAMKTAAFAGQYGLQPQVMVSGVHKLLVYGNSIPGPVLHVYIDGDGRPWRTPATVALDPSPQRPLALEWMVQDANAAVYLGRPCYYADLTRERRCDPLLWTHQRYSQHVVDTMAIALRQLMDDRPTAKKIVLIGYSGGGTLAALLAQRDDRVSALVTVAANLDIARWTSLHGLAPLQGSQNPMDLPRLPIPQLHLAGDRDGNVPAAIISDFSIQQRGRYQRYQDFDHVCCWREQWPNILQLIDTL